MSNVKSWGKFLSGLNSAGKTGRVIKTIPDFSPDADPEFVKFNIAIANAKKSGHFVITRKSDKFDYVSLECDDLAPFLNNEYVGVLTTKGSDVHISEFKKISSREYVDNTEYQPLEEVTKIEPVDANAENEFKTFNKTLKAAAKFNCIVKDKNGYDDEHKGVDTLKKFIKYKYFGFFSKKPNFLEYVRIGCRIVADEMEAPVIYGGTDATNIQMVNVGEFLKIETKVVEPKKVAKAKKVKNVANYISTYANAITYFAKDSLGCIRRKDNKTSYDYNFIGGFLFHKPSNYPAKMIDSFLPNEYNAIVSKDKVYEFYRFNIRPITNDMEIDSLLVERLKENGVWEGEEYETKKFNDELDNAVALIRGKKGFEVSPLGKDQTGLIKRLVDDNIEYFGIRSTSGKLYEFIRIDVRERKSKEEPIIYK